MRVDGFELRRIRLPLVSPFRTSFGVEAERDILLVRAGATHNEGWGECVASVEPLYSEEYVDGAAHVIEHHLVPRLLDRDDLTAADIETVLAPVRGHPMSKAALEAAVLDLELRESDQSLADRLGATRTAVDAGVSVGIMDSVPELLDAVAGYLDDGYRRVKLKIEPGWDVDIVRTVRERFGDGVPLQVDANAAYTARDADQLAGLDPFGLLLIEQPLAEDDIVGHAAVARRVATPICLDESIRSVHDAAAAIALGACTIVNIKPGRVGGLLEAARIHDFCEAHGVAVWCGGMLETGIGRAGNVALAAMPNFTLPNDTSASRRYFTRDITEPFELHDGQLLVPNGPGIGVTPDPTILDEVTIETRWLS